MASITKRDVDGTAVFILDMGDTENRFNLASVASINECLDEVEQADGARALVTTGRGKFFSNGLDLDELMSGEVSAEDFLGPALGMLGRVLTFPAPTVAAINGHAFAGGAMLAIAHDRRVMRADRGFWCVNEVLLGMQFTPGMLELLKERLPTTTFHKALTAAHRFGGDEAEAAGIADELAPEAEVVERAVALVAPLGPTAGPVLGEMKGHMYPTAARLLADGVL